MNLPVIILTFLTAAYAHSWIEQIHVIAPNGTFVGAPGYARGNVLRTAPGFSDPEMTFLIPPDTQANNTMIVATQQMCMSTQRTHNQTAGSPRLQASVGAAIALRYQENGHVTLPWNQPGKPPNRGTGYVYGTQEPRVNETFLSIHKVWNQNGTGGDGRGVLLSVQNFDDGRCYQINTGNISEHRQVEYPHVANTLMGADLWCQQDLKLPSDAETDKPYTLYWVWDWPTAPGVDPDLPDGKIEIYTTCMDIDLVDSNSTASESTTEGHTAADYVADQSLDSAAIPSEFAELSEDASEADISTPSATSAPSQTATTASSTKLTTFVTLTKTVEGTGCQPAPTS
ncbi:hypothetical protein ASPZODRAFT_65802 [Penicilliopsis zonata CBS 506.65]|uniref:DUF7492 domain-containing protein n=1 Tax=Penicilliopsis zonata CBS 506.65 TaxID=1073090 RepID=A0A1L9SIQ6_9EURO|nr:hypothetical protein ASPZODRAFT_65802 [Penicilliopsis zonata CBS 506.65]OJJ46981.1 hypothetical protein ASPZODRAFT_65802 [Penicilliopsis zonata CBS 506.65]